MSIKYWHISNNNTPGSLYEDILEQSFDTQETQFVIPGEMENSYLADMNNRGEFEDLRDPDRPYIICNRNYPNLKTDDEHSFTEELYIKFDSMMDYLNYGRWQPLKGSIRFWVRSVYKDQLRIDVRENIDELGDLYEYLRANGLYFTKYFRSAMSSRNNDIEGEEAGVSAVLKYRPIFETDETNTTTCIGHEPYDYGVGFPAIFFAGDNYLHRIDIYEFPMRLESVSITRDGSPKTNGQIYATVTYDWTIPLLDTDQDGNKLNPETKPWFYRVDDVSVGTDSLEEAIEKIYPDMTSGNSWADDLESITLDERTAEFRYKYKVAKARNARNANKEQALKTYGGDKKATGYINAIKNADKAYDKAVKKAREEFSKEYPFDDDYNLVLGDDENVELDEISVPFANSAGVMMEGTKSRFLLKIDFSYNAPDFDFSAPLRYKNKVNSKTVSILGVEYPPKSVLINDLGAKMKREYEENGDLKFEYWTISISLTVDEKTFNREYANVGQHVREKIFYAIHEEIPETNGATSTPQQVSFEIDYADKYYRIGDGVYAGMIITEDRKKWLEERNVRIGTLAEVKILSKPPYMTDFSPRLDSLVTDENNDCAATQDYMLTQKSVYSQGIAATPVTFFDNAPSDYSFTVMQRNKLAAIYQDDGHYYTKAQHDLSRPGHDMEPIAEPMFLSRDGTKLSPFRSDGKQVPVYLKGCIYESIDFSELGIPEVA